MQVPLLQKEGGELSHYSMGRRRQCQEILLSFNRNNMAIMGCGEWGSWQVQ